MLVNACFMNTRVILMDLSITDGKLKINVISSLSELVARFSFHTM